MPDYSNGKIYKLTSSNTDLIYIGSTTKTLQQRLSAHKYHHKLWKDNKFNFMTSFKVFEDGNDAIIELLETYPCDSKKNLELRERYYIESHKCVNKCVPTRDHRESCKQYRETNKDIIHKKEKEKVTCVCGSQMRKDGKSAHLKTIKHQTFVKQQFD
jgi:hypothetical protein